jgi:hypothetical protein
MKILSLFELLVFKMNCNKKVGHSARLFILIFVLLSSQVAADEPLLEKIYTYTDGGNTRVAFETDTRIEFFKSFLLSAPDRLVIELNNTRIPNKTIVSSETEGPIIGMRTFESRVVLDLANPVDHVGPVYTQTSTRDHVYTFVLQLRSVNNESGSEKRLDALVAALALLYKDGGYWTEPEPGFDRLGVSCREMLAVSRTGKTFTRFTRNNLVIKSKLGGNKPFQLDEKWVKKAEIETEAPAKFTNFEVNGDIVTFERYAWPKNGSYIGSIYELNTTKKQLQWVKQLICENCVEEQLIAFKAKRNDPPEPQIWCFGSVD